jgi:hypothetical protein
LKISNYYFIFFSKEVTHQKFKELFCPTPKEIIFGIDQLRKPLLNPVVTLGNFDGVHLGHQAATREMEAQKTPLR